MTHKVRILSIDGGGIRGIIAARVLVKLEEMLQRKSGRADARIADYFDLIAGTSTGGILACLLLCPAGSADADADSASPGTPCPKYSAKDALDLYLERGPQIFHAPLWHRIRAAGGLNDERYPADGLERAADDYFGDVRLRQLLKPCLVTAYDIQRRRAHFFTQHDAHREGKDYRVCDVVRATSAAPTYFECANIHSETGVPYPLIDGGVFANNPALCAYAEARSGLARALELSEGPTAKDMLILSLGTGQLTRRYPYAKAKDWGAIGWMRPLFDILLAGVAETVDYQIRQIYDAVGAPHQYLRIQPELAEAEEDLDNADAGNLIRLTQIGTEIAEAKDADLDRFAAQLFSF
jgi:uncharacterized protein